MNASPSYRVDTIRRSLVSLKMPRALEMFDATLRGASNRNRSRLAARRHHLHYQTAKLGNCEPQAWLADVVARIAITPPAGSISSCRGTGRRNQ